MKKIKELGKKYKRLKRINFFLLIALVFVSVSFGFIIFVYKTPQQPKVFEPTDLQPSPFFTKAPIHPITIGKDYVEIKTPDGRKIDTVQTSGTGSMRPMFTGGSIVFFIEPRKEEIRAGDIISFKAPNRENQILHRVVNITDGFYLTKGDNNEHNDLISFGYLISFENITGKAVGVLW
jgi:signal peptidase I